MLRCQAVQRMHNEGCQQAAGWGRLKGELGLVLEKTRDRHMDLAAAEYQQNCTNNEVHNQAELGIHLSTFQLSSCLVNMDPLPINVRA